MKIVGTLDVSLPIPPASPGTLLRAVLRCGSCAAISVGGGRVMDDGKHVYAIEVTHHAQCAVMARARETDVYDQEGTDVVLTTLEPTN